MPEVAQKRRPPPPAYKPAPVKRHKWGWLWVLLGMTLSIISSGGYFLFQGFRNRVVSPVNSVIDKTPLPIPPAIKESIAPQPESAQPPATVIPPKTPPAPQTKTPPAAQNKSPTPESGTSFDFYKLLPEMKVGMPLEIAPNSPTPGKNPPKPITKEITAKTTGKTPPPPVNVNPVNVNNVNSGYILQAGSFHSHQEADNLRARLTLLGLEPRIYTSDKLHRVRIGPFRDFQQATQMQQRLQKNGFSTILTKESH